MISESRYWKEQLIESAKWLRRVRLSDNTRESTCVRIEKELFVGFYSVRKLLETVKVSDATKALQFELEWFANLSPVGDLTWHRIDRHYDLTNPQSGTRDIWFFCNQFIHSYVFVVAGEIRIDGVFIASDWMRNKRLHFVSLDTVLKIFRVVGRDYPNYLHYTGEPGGVLEKKECR